MATSVFETIKSKYQISAAELARRLKVADATVVRVLNGNRGIGTSLLKRTYKVFPEEVISWLQED